MQSAAQSQLEVSHWWYNPGLDFPPEEWVIHQMTVLPFRRNLNRLEKWAKRYLMKFSKGSCKALHLERRNPRHQNLLEADQLESSSHRGALESWWTAS